MSYQTISKRSPPFWLLIGARKTQVFWHQSEGRTAANVWNRSGKPLSPGGSSRRSLLFFCALFFRPFRLSLAPNICPRVSEDVVLINLVSIFETATGVNSHYLCKSLLNKQVGFFFIIYQYRSSSLSTILKLDKGYQHIFYY